MNNIDLNDFDWPYVFQYAGDCNPEEHSVWGEPNISACIGTTTSTSPVLRADVVRIFAAAEGENAGPNWLIVVELNDGRFAFLSAGCDYTGWDCQAGGHCIVDTDLEHLVRLGLGEEDRARLGLTLTEGVA